MDYRSDLYKHYVLDLAKNPSNYGLIPGADFLSKKINPSCGDVITICGFVKDNTLQNIRFEASGCVISIAMASLLTDFAQNKSLDDAMKLDEQIIEQLLSMSLGINRLQCGMLSIIALQDGIRSFIQQLKV
jgi:nitrogen fixation NifU-like protein